MDKELNVLMITHHQRYKAAGRSLPMAESLVKRGHHVTLVATSNHRLTSTWIDETNGVRIVEAPDLLKGRLRSGWDLWDMLQRMKFLNREDGSYDLVHCFETRPTTIYPALDFIRKQKIPLVTDWNDWFGRGGIITVLRPPWYQALFGWLETYYEEAFRTRAAGLTVISTALGRRAEKLGVPKDHIRYIPGGVTPGRFERLPIAECRQKAGYPPDAPILGFASADSYLDLEIVMEALAIVARAHPDVILVITGKAGKGVLETARNYGVEDRVTLTGFVPAGELAWHLGSANLFVMPFPDKIYNVGRWPNKIGLYMCLGRPTVTNPYGDIRPLFEEHDIGLLAEWQAEDFADKICRLIDDPEFAAELGENARKLALTEYNWDCLVCRLEDFYDQILKEAAN